MAAAMGDMKLSPLFGRQRSQHPMSRESLFAKLLFTDGEYLVHRLQLGLQLCGEGVSIEWFIGACCWNDSKWGRSAGRKISKTTNKELLDSLIGFRPGLSRSSFDQAIAEDRGRALICQDKVLYNLAGIPAG